MTRPSAESEVRQEARVSPVAGCLISLSIGLAAVACLAFILQLTLRGDITLGQGSANETRLWLIREDANQGLGLSRTRTLFSVGARAPCTETDVRFLLWRSDVDYPPVTACRCASPDGDVQRDGPCPR
jgi:hypothetical protein